MSFVQVLRRLFGKRTPEEDANAATIKDRVNTAHQDARTRADKHFPRR